MNLKKRFIYFITLSFLLSSCIVDEGHAFSFFKKKKNDNTPVENQNILENDYPFAEELPNDYGEGEFENNLPNETQETVKKSDEPVVYVKNIKITGNKLVSDEAILDAMSTKTGMIYDKDLIKVNLRQIYEMGYFSDKIKAVPTLTSDGVILNIQVEENLPITAFVVKGNEVVTTDKIQEILSSQVGMPQNIVEINKAINSIENYYAERGYILARVMNIYDEPDGTVFVEIDEGILDEIKFSGNTKTKDYVIERNISVVPDTVYNDNVLQKDILRLYSTGAFGNVKRSLSPSEKNPDKYCLTIEVEEKRTGSISIGGGLDLTTGLFGTLSYADRNFLGRGQQTSLSFSTGTGAMLGGSDVLDKADFQAEAKFIEPRLLGSMTSLEAGAFANSWASFQIPLATEQRYGANIELARPFKKYPHLTGGISVGVEYDTIQEGDENKARMLFYQANEDFAQRADQLVSGLYVNVTPTLVFDTRDNLQMPRSGTFAMGKLNGAIKTVGDADSYMSVSGTVKKYVPVAKASTLVLTARAAGNLVGDMPEFAAYRLGGARTLRGFKEGHVGRGYGFVSGSLEYRTPIPFMDKITSNEFLNNTRFAVFVDGGHILSPALSQDLYGWPGYAITAGVGLRFFIPGLGPLSLDYGIPFTNVGDNNSKNGQFTFFFGESY